MIYNMDPDPDVIPPEFTGSTDPEPLLRENWGDAPLTKRIAP